MKMGKVEMEVDGKENAQKGKGKIEWNEWTLVGRLSLPAC
jgi:hypothetical protein